MRRGRQIHLLLLLPCVGRCRLSLSTIAAAVSRRTASPPWPRRQWHAGQVGDHLPHHRCYVLRRGGVDDKAVHVVHRRRAPVAFEGTCQLLCAAACRCRCRCCRPIAAAASRRCRAAAPAAARGQASRSAAAASERERIGACRDEGCIRRWRAATTNTAAAAIPAITTAAAAAAAPRLHERRKPSLRGCKRLAARQVVDDKDAVAARDAAGGQARARGGRGAADVPQLRKSGGRATAASRQLGARAVKVDADGRAVIAVWSVAVCCDWWWCWVNEVRALVSTHKQLCQRARRGAAHLAAAV